ALVLSCSCFCTFLLKFLIDDSNADLPSDLQVALVMLDFFSNPNAGGGGGAAKDGNGGGG
ncbi:MAG TPA: hypothetical protein LFW14_07685, partial [Rickettsia endosymbiont of Degeeriella rufa]|nr:hypothetical protein [Rickettsia endosymbiont of Degeeriella rufa]